MVVSQYLTAPGPTILVAIVTYCQRWWPTLSSHYRPLCSNQSAPFLTGYPWSTSSTPLPVSCVLPHLASSGDGTTFLNKFTAKSRQHNGARILLWPEARSDLKLSPNKRKLSIGFEMRSKLHRTNANWCGWERFCDGKWRNGLYRFFRILQTQSGFEYVFKYISYFFYTVTFTSQLQSLAHSLKIKATPN